MFGKRDRFIEFVRDVNDYPGGFDAVFALVISWIQNTNAAYDVFLDEVALAWDIKEYAPSDVLFVRARQQAQIDRAAEDMFAKAALAERLRTTLKELDFAEQAAGLRFSGARLTQEQLATLTPGTIVIRDAADRRLRQSGRYNDTSMLGFADIETNLHEDGLSTYRILWHEVGHALHHLHIRSKYRSLRTAFPDYFAEALAQVFEFVVVDVQWTQRVCHADPIGASRLRRAVLSLELQKTRENAMWALWENEIQANPESYGRSDAWARLAERILYPRLHGLEMTPGEAEYQERLVHFPYSALQIVMTVLIREHLLHALSKHGTMFIRESGEALKQLYAFGGSRHWTEAVQAVTGQALTAVSAATHFNEVLGASS